MTWRRHTYTEPVKLSTDAAVIAYLLLISGNIHPGTLRSAAKKSLLPLVLYVLPSRVVGSRNRLPT